MTVQESRAFWIARPGAGEIRSEVLRDPSPDEVCVRTLYSGISRGTEALVFQGRVPQSEHERMRAPFQVGDFSGPLKYGYASVGRVECGPSELQDRVVFVLYPHQTRYVVPSASVFVLPESVPPERAILVANLETALNGIWDAAVQIGDRVAVIGGGTVGCLAAWLASRVIGCDVQLVDVNPRRSSIAQRLGVSFATPSEIHGDFDRVVHASGSADGLALALNAARFEATIVEMSWYGNQTVPIALGERFHSQRLTIKSSQVGHVAATQRGRWDTRRRMALALSMLASPELDALITGESDFEDLPRVLEQLATAPGDTICHRIRYPENW